MPYHPPVYTLNRRWVIGDRLQVMGNRRSNNATLLLRLPMTDCLLPGNKKPRPQVRDEARKPRGTTLFGPRYARSPLSEVPTHSRPGNGGRIRTQLLSFEC